MSGEINITQTVLARANWLNNWADEISGSLKKPTKEALASASVDVVLIKSMEQELYTLINKVDQKARQQLNGTLLTTRNKIEMIQQDLAQKITSVDHKNLKSEQELPKQFVDLQARANKIFAELEDLEESFLTGNTAFNDPQAALEILDLKTKEIVQIRQATNEQQVIQKLSLAQTKIQTIKEMINIFNTPSATQPMPSQNNAPRFFFAKQNQYSDQYDNCYQGQVYKRSACTAIAGHFVLDTMQGGSADNFDKIMLTGQQTNARMMHENPPIDGEHFEFPGLLVDKEFAALDQLDIPENILQNNPFFMNVDILKGKEAFREKIAALKQIQKTQDLDYVGAVITARGESYGLVIFKDNDLIVFFDSHGYQDLTQNPNAYAVSFSSLEKAAEFLAKRMPVVEGFEDPHYNTATLTPVCLKPVKVNLADQFGEDQQEFDDFLQRQQLNRIENLTLQPMINLLAQATALGNAADLFAQKDEENSISALSLLTDLVNDKIPFAMSGNELRSIGDRASFHLYQIQDKESPQKVDRNDHTYGSTAMQSPEKSTPEERVRAVQRTLIEVAFADMENAINDQALLNQFLDLLEGLKLDEKDMPKDKKNIAHYLFEKLYHHYSAEYKEDFSLLDPHHQAFKGDFGRTAFRGEGDVRISPLALIAPQFKLDVIRQVRDELKQIWIK